VTRYCAGVDPSGGGTDEFAWAIAHAEANRVVVDLVRGRGRRGRAPLDLDAVVSECVADLHRFSIQEVHGDHYGGDWPAKAFRTHGIR